MAAELPPASEALRIAIQLKDSAKANQALDQGADVSARDVTGATPLHQLLGSWGDPQLLERLLRAGADIEAVDGSGLTPLARAVRSFQYRGEAPRLRAVVATLLARKASATVRDDQGRSLLEAAIEQGDPVLFEQLQSAGAPMPEGALQRVMGPGASIVDLDLLQTVLAASGEAQLRARSADGSTLAHRLAVSPRTLPVLQALGARMGPAFLFDEADDGRTALHDAALSGNVDTLRWLVAQGGDLRAVDEDSRGMLHMACVSGHVAMLGWLLEQKPDLALRDRWGMRPVDLYVESSGFAMTEERYRLGRVRALGGGEQEMARGRTPDSPLHKAIEARDIRAVRELLENGGDPDVVDGNGYPALYKAMSLSTRSLNVPDDYRFGQKLLKLLLEHGADLSRRIPAQGRTILQAAEEGGRREELERLARRRSR